jgi:lipopolysaccharide-binding protein
MSFLLFLFMAAITALAPALQVTISPGAINYIAAFVKAPLLSDLKNAQIPTQTGRDKTPVGDLDVTLDTFKVTSVGLSTIAVSPHGGNALVVELTGLDLSLTCNWKYRRHSWPHVSDHGTADISISNSRYTAELQLLDNTGVPGVKASSCVVNIGSFSLKLHGGASWLYNLLLKLFQKNIENAIASAIDSSGCATIAKTLNQALASIPLTEPIGSYLNVEYMLVNTPQTSSYGLTLDSLGEIVARNAPAQDPCATSVLPPPLSGSAMIEFELGRCALDSIGWALYQAKKLELMITDSELPANSPFHMTTDFFEFIIPVLYAQYPQRNLTGYVNAVQPPVTYFDGSGNIIINVTANINVSVAATASQPAVAVFTLQTQLSIAVALVLNATAIQPTISYQSSATSLVWSDVGTTFGGVLGNLLAAAIQFLMIPLANAELQYGLPLPSAPVRRASVSTLTEGFF